LQPPWPVAGLRILGLNEGEIERLRQRKVIGTRPDFEI
jgi:hypothetical protein